MDDRNSRMVGNFISRNIPVGDEGVVGVIERGEVRHLRWTTVWILSLSEKLVDRINGVGLHGIVSREDDKHWDVRLMFQKEYEN